ncbi:MAG: hypothetical protein IPJ79_06845 [Bacteroidetes bacterium]|nr:hypothetical protein [Bacteroidota bacterium]
MIDGESPTGFSKTTATGAFDNSAGTNKETVINSSSVYNKILGGLDEFAIYHFSLPPNMIYKHYIDFKNNFAHYQYANAAITVPTPSLLQQV